MEAPGDMGDELLILQRVVSDLETARIHYMVTGSIALAVYAEPRMTRDADIVIELAPTDVDRFVELFEKEFHCDRDRIRDAVDRHSMFNLIHTKTIVKIDYVVRKDTPFRIEEFGRRRQVDVAGHQLWVVTREDLILSKLDWARDSRSEIQLRDVRLLLATDAGLDNEYLDRWAAVLGVSTTLAEMRP